MAGEAGRRGAEVTLIAGPTTAAAPAVREIVHVRGAAEMHGAVLHHAEHADVVIMAAAVADYTPERRAVQKITKRDDELTVVLKKTPDILADLGARRAASGRGPLLIGFAAETENVVARAAAKREAKQVDLIVANDVSREDAGFEVDTNAVTIVGPDGSATLPLQPKSRVAITILDRIEGLLLKVPR